MMRLPYLKGHQRSAEGLYKQRLMFLGQPFTEATLLDSIESRLRRDVTAVAKAGYPKDAPNKPAEVFVACACAGFRQDADACGPAVDLAKCSPAHTRAVLDAWMLCSPPNLDDEFLGLARAYAPLGPGLVELYQATGRTIANDSIEALESLATEDAALRAALLHYAAVRTDAPVEHFASFYDSQDERIQLSAVWGALLRHDIDAKQIVRNKAQQTENVTQWGRLLALLGEVEDLPLLQRLAEVEPKQGLPLLALHGRRESVPLLLHALTSAETAESAASAWYRLFGINLPQKPRFAVVDNAGKEEVPVGGETADASAAEMQWEQMREQWPDDERRLYGCSVNAPNLASLALQRAGEQAVDLLDLLLFISGGQVYCHPRLFIEIRQSQLSAYEKPRSEDGKHA
ncbi:hypothetical protein CAI21_15345 [Alkalilimnicola ehrlichii]|uniref:TIGR02270 family protein n=1 Tax=Alkalilimnicola ehrlichii TaxID=351052 RepID=A0A3E0WT73_9GAMM|nr:hypothetical protein [Alkalilimnicola ehrlichii]RFA27220.1 hypothetical protein CAI21_15345 [Alkalilimnicola ehrlichii]RFA35393.1 hypothetical protein CAL65_13010 [Alkalilimnicola ehrlichii]